MSTAKRVECFDSNDHCAASKIYSLEGVRLRAPDKLDTVTPKERAVLVADDFKIFKPSSPPKAGHNGTLNAFCEAFLLYYGGHVESYDVQLFWFNVHIWCQDEVLLSIENGTFAHDLDAGVIPSWAETDTAWSNKDANDMYGTWHVATDDDDDRL